MFRLDYQNPVFKPLILLFLASTLNDWWAITIGIPTPVQLALVYGIYTFLLRYKKVEAVNLFVGLRKVIVFYLTVIVLSTGFVFYTTGYFNVTAVTILINLIWIITAMPFLSLGFTDEDILLFIKQMATILLCITVPFGMYELIFHKTFLNTAYGLSDQVFYVRGLHIDKIEFAGMMALATFICVSVLGRQVKGFPSLFVMVLLFSSLLLISVSYSSTAALGVIVGILAILFQGNKKGLLLIPFLGVVLIIGFELLSNTVLFSNLMASYNLKYELNVNQSSDRNFRYMAWDAAWEEIAESPVLGYGIGSSGKIVQDYFVKSLNYFTNEYIDLTKEINTHNLLFNELLDFGIVGFVPLLLIISIIFYYLLNNYTAESNVLEVLKKVCIGLSCLLLVRFVLYYHRFDQTIYILWMALIMGLWATKINRLEDESIGMREEAR